MNDPRPEGLHLLHVFPTFAAGGTQLRMAGIMNGMGSSVRHTVVALDGRLQAAAAVRAGIPFRTVAPPSGKGGLLYPLALRRMVKAAAPDLLLTYNWGAIDAALGAGLSPLCPVIHNECGFGPEEAAGMKTRRLLMRRLVLNRIYTTVVVSRGLLTIAREQFKLRPEKVRWIRTGVDAEKFQPGSEAGWRGRFGLSEKDLVFGYVGGLRAEKRLELLLSAFAQASVGNAKLVLIGEGNCRRDLQELVDGLGIADRVVFVGQVQDPRPWLRALDVFVMSSGTEQTPNALLEAMACGLPAICTDVGDCADILGLSGQPAVVPPGDLAAYVRALRAFAGNRELRLARGVANRQRVVTLYSSERMIREYAALYYAAAGRAGGIA
jgi:glycosyltransferase involved in cell wall biosynthesis